MQPENSLESSEKREKTRGYFQGFFQVKSDPDSPGISQNLTGFRGTVQPGKGRATGSQSAPGDTAQLFDIQHYF